MRGSPVRFSDFRGGLNTKNAPYLVDTTESRDCLNVISTSRGAILKRNGNTTFSSPANQLHSLFPLEATASKFLVGFGSTKAFSISTAGAAVDISGAAVITSGLRWDAVQAPVIAGQGPFYAMNGTDTPLQWTGAGNVAAWTAVSGTLFNGKYLTYHMNRVWICGTTANPSRLYWSDIGDPTAWPSANRIDFDPADGDAITGMGTFGSYLLIFKRNKVFAVYDDATGANRRVTRNVGAVSHRSIVETPQGTFFLSGDKGIWTTDGSAVKLVSDKISPTVDSLIDTAKVNAAGAFYKNHYYLSVCASGSANNRTLDYDTQLDAWWLHSNGEAQFAIWKPTSGEELHAANDASAKVDRCYVDATFQDNGVTFDAYWVSAWHAFDTPYLKKRLRSLHFDGTGTVDLYLGSNFGVGFNFAKGSVFQTSSTLFGGTGTYGGSGIYGDTSSVSEGLVYTQGVARVWSVKFDCNANATFLVNGYTFHLTQRKHTVTR